MTLYMEEMTIAPMPRRVVEALNGLLSPKREAGDTAHAVILSGRVVREKGHSIHWESN
jgi:hypothetical protein